MRRLIQRKETAKRTSRTRRQQNLPIAAEAPLAAPEATTIPAPGSPAAVVKEEPLPFMVAEMALWGAAMSALVIPIGMATVLASPFAIAREMWRARGSDLTAQTVVVPA